ncbi:Phosphotransferase enzyme family protein [Paenibacillus konkukensis]|uniref:Phosphotransferase enzyme family protein n=2 Tax=Paenibacillus TaxID=44249 RepID=A0ABY4RTC7_9BACL|nr:Phosphotransferase enzyme family protein [Paenibacillus konkukensis]
MDTMTKLSEGRTAEVFTQDQGKILKLYRNGFPKEAVKYEYEVNRIVARLGIPAPATYDIIDVDDRSGIVFERIEGETLLRMGIQHPDDLDRLIAEFTDLHYQIHKHELDTELVGASPVLKQKAVLARNIRNAAPLSDEMKAKIIDDLEKLPDGNYLCHGDFHPENVMIGQRSWIIDWMTGMIGNPAGDVARTLLLFRFGTLPEEAPQNVKDALERMREKINGIYLQQYLSYSGLQLVDIEAWTLPVAAARLCEWIPDEEKALLIGLIEERL